MKSNFELLMDADDVDRKLRVDLDDATTKLLVVAELMADGCTVGNWATLQNRLRARAKACRVLRAKLRLP